MDANPMPLDEAVKHLRAGLGEVDAWKGEKFSAVAATRIAALRTVLAALSQPQAVAVPEGWALVPVEPTPEMMTAGEDAYGNEYIAYEGAIPDDVVCHSVMRAMGSAAPPAPSAWRPIAETDKTGLPMLIGWWDNKGEWHERRAWWDPEFESEWDDQADDTRYIGAWTDSAVKSWGYQERASYEPTHVMDLPAPPAQAEGGR